MAVIDHNQALWELEIIRRTESGIVCRPRGSAEGTKIQNKLQTDEANIRVAAIVDWPRNNRLEDGSVSCSNSIGHRSARRVMERHDREMIHVEPILTKMLVKIELEAVDDGRGVHVGAKCLKVYVGRQWNGVQRRFRDVKSMGSLGDGHGGIHLGVDVQGGIAEFHQDGVLWSERCHGSDTGSVRGISHDARRDRLLGRQWRGVAKANTTKGAVGDTAMAARRRRQ